MNRIASRATALIILALLLVVGFGFFLVEYFTQSENWVIQSGSPHVYNGESLGCGVIVDRDNTLILNLLDGRNYSNSQLLRQATIHWVGDRYGAISAPITSYYAAEIAGFDRLNGVYHYGQPGGVAELTLSAAMQMAALEAMGEYKGTVAVYNYQTGQILCAVTTPTYDPDNVPQFADGDTQYEGLYVNRFTQSAYIPGSIFKVVTLAAALEENPAIIQQTFSCVGSYRIGNEEITCEEIHWEQSLQMAFRNSCNCAFAQIAQQLGGDTLQQYVEKFGVTDRVSFDGITTVKGNFQSAGQAELNVAWASIGQHLDQVNPCAFLKFMGAVANDGRAAAPYLVEQITVGNDRTYQAKAQYDQPILSKETVAILQEYLQFNVTDKYGAENFSGLVVGAKTGTAEVGGDKKPNAMLSGFVDDASMPLAFIVCVEDGGYGRAVCIPIISKILQVAQQSIK